jgi:hypothetical protein
MVRIMSRSKKYAQGNMKFACAFKNTHALFPAQDLMTTKPCSNLHGFAFQVQPGRMKLNEYRSLQTS